SLIPAYLIGTSIQPPVVTTSLRVSRPGSAQLGYGRTERGNTREIRNSAMPKSIIDGPGRNEKVSAIKRPVTLIKPPKKMDATMNPFILFATFFATEAGP